MSPERVQKFGPRTCSRSREPCLAHHASEWNRHLGQCEQFGQWPLNASAIVRIGTDTGADAFCWAPNPDLGDENGEESRTESQGQDRHAHSAACCTRRKPGPEKESRLRQAQRGLSRTHAKVARSRPAPARRSVIAKAVDAVQFDVERCRKRHVAVQAQVGEEPLSLAAVSAERRGGCACGRVQYAVTGEPLRVGLCHCTSCRQESGSAFTAYAIWPRSAFRSTGEFSTWEGRSFCPECGSRAVRAERRRGRGEDGQPGRRAHRARPLITSSGSGVASIGKAAARCAPVRSTIASPDQLRAGTGEAALHRRPRQRRGRATRDVEVVEVDQLARAVEADQVAHPAHIEMSAMV